MNKTKGVLKKSRKHITIRFVRYVYYTLFITKLSEVSEVPPIIDENVRNVTMIFKTEENLRIMCKEAMSENGFLQVLQALHSLNVFQALHCRAAHSRTVLRS